MESAVLVQVCCKVEILLIAKSVYDSSAQPLCAEHIIHITMTPASVLPRNARGHAYALPVTCGHATVGRVVDFGPGTDPAAAFAKQKALNAPGKSPPFCSEF